MKVIKCLLYPSVYERRECDEKCPLAEHCGLKHSDRMVSFICDRCGFEITIRQQFYNEQDSVHCPICRAILE